MPILDDPENQKTCTHLTILPDGHCARCAADCRPSAPAFRYASRLLKAAKDVFHWYYIFGEDNDAAREHLAELGNAIKNYESREKYNGRK